MTSFYVTRENVMVDYPMIMGCIKISLTRCGAEIMFVGILRKSLETP